MITTDKKGMDMVGFENHAKKYIKEVVAKHLLEQKEQAIKEFRDKIDRLSNEILVESTIKIIAHMNFNQGSDNIVFTVPIRE